MRRVLTYLLLSVAVVALGALGGWYFFLRSQTTETQAFDTARGFGSDAGAPFGQPAGQGQRVADTGTKGGRAPQLWRLSTAPAAGIGFSTTTEGIRARFVERATGYVFDADPESSGVARVGSTLMPKVYEALIASGGRVFERTLKDGGIETVVGTAASSSGATLSFSPLKRAMTAVAPDPRSNSIAYLVPEGSGEALMTSLTDGAKEKRLLSLPVAGWRLSWLSDGRIVLVQKAADSLVGYAYTVKNGALQPLISALGLIAFPQSGTGALLYSSSGSTGVALLAQASSSASVVRLPIATIADKCAWSPERGVAYCAVPQSPVPAPFLDAWYRGEVHTSDAWWRVDVRSGQAELIFTPPSTSRLDVINPVVDDRGEYIAFMNYADLSPWVLRINK